ncbi:MAG: hypothetical protein B6D59_04415 [Campylobacteraceae bacterium 4484_4]|nr:MAG: hypothetical protein B6D59_04415 [Campylobacteraceae bacterium 4484_4]
MMKSHKTTQYTIGGTVLIAGIYLLCLNIPRELFFRYADEGAFGEWAGAIGLLVGSLLFGYLFIVSKGEENRFLGRVTQRNIYFLLLALLLFVAFGEEISWGQRVFGLKVPQSLQQINAQKELNFHNLWIFQTYNPDGTQKGFWQRMINPNRLFSIFWFLFCLIVPILDHLSQKAHILFQKMGLPIGPVWIGLLFLANFLIFHSVIGGLDLETLDYLDEVKEAIMEILFAMVGVWFFIKRLSVANQIDR